ncbi:EcoAI/FtnUII family type I restriction enzme subunit R [Methanobrevibacter boviskoreani]|uniref:EcoAI/FtnUII family type I restriction enzme subunit R n=1 Tax=Methanobrevibacter boviskoreani TaxID=1348249 RepID=UPI0023F0B909|nr:DEAD/DEAH box helicase family protein [Methanobrevibacter boviskoreani]MDD6257426.1 DEAD/DEAH box helicase family protein [Methanobrevibacter boviskoreani]
MSSKLSEEDVKFRYITPSISKSGWSNDQIKMEYAFTDGEMKIRGKKVKRGARKRADYLLSYNEIPLAIVEAKDMNHSLGDGMIQAINYAEILDIPYVYSSNGTGFLEHDMKEGCERELSLDEFPSPEDLWKRYTFQNDIDEYVEDIITEPNYWDSNYKKVPRYYQRIAINRTVEAIAKGQNRILIVMATGTGKTFTAFQIVHKLCESGTKKKVLYLADRNILIDQTMEQDFKPFEDVMTKITNHNIDSSYEVYFSLYQQLVDKKLDVQPYEKLQPNFFDLIVVDECHRGSAKYDSEWRTILEYFSSATQIGMTATPKETKDVSNIHYFGDPIYTYSLKQGIEDGFLAPYKVIRILLDIDVSGYLPEKGKVDLNGKEIESRIYNTKDFDKEIIVDDRTRIVAKRITEFLKQTNRFNKTIVFCVDINHAERMRQALVNENKDLIKENPRYVMRITGDNPEGKKELDYFIAEDEKYPVIATTSRLMGTGVDCKTCKVIALDKNIESMTEFKQIIGRGTRLREDLGKNFFTILDFRNNVRNFSDPDFDGKPIQNNKFDGNEPIHLPDSGEYIDIPEEDEEMDNHIKYHVNDVPVNVILEQNLCYDKDGNLITENLVKFSKNNILNEFDTLDNFIKEWTSYDKKEAIVEELYKHNIFLDELREASGNKDMDDFDLICHIAFDKKPLTRQERANNVKKRDYLSKYEGVSRSVIEGLLDKYANSGIENLESIKTLENDPFRQFGSPKKIAKLFGGKEELLNAMHDLKKEIYA